MNGYASWCKFLYLEVLSPAGCCQRPACPAVLQSRTGGPDGKGGTPLIIWLWSAADPGKFSGVTDDDHAARLAAARCITSGQAETATVEAASLVLRVSSLTDFYHRTGIGWTARRSDWGVCWVPLATGIPA